MDEAGKNIRRNGLMSLAALTTVTIAMAVLGGALYLLFRLTQFAEAQPRQFEIAVFMQMETTREKTLEAQKRIASLPGVSRVTLYSREQALADMRQQDRERATGITDALGDENPLPDRLDVHLDDPAQTKVFAALLRDRKTFPDIEAVRDGHETLDRLLATSRLVRNVGGVIALILFAATVLVIQNTIRLTVFARRREIRIMQLVGATPGFIRLPMTLEGIFYGIVGAAMAGGLVLFVVYQVSQYTSRFQTPLAQSLPSAISPWLMIGMLTLLGGLIGWLGSLLSIRRFLKRI